MNEQLLQELERKNSRLGELTTKLDQEKLSKQAIEAVIAECGALLKEITKDFESLITSASEE